MQQRERISVDVPPVSGIASTDSPLVTKDLAMTKTGRCACGAVKFGKRSGHYS
jgi:hypothetical protein